MKIACLTAPHLPVQVERHRDPRLAARPLIIGGQAWDPGAVLDCCPEAAAAGVQQGMRLARAETLCPSAHFIPADEPAYHTAHQALDQVLRQFTDRVETAGLGMLFANVAGLERAHGPDSHLALQLQMAVRQTVELDVRIGIASGRFTAEQAAQAASPHGHSAIPAGRERAFLAPLPLNALPCEDEFIRRLHLLGVRRLGALAALPRLALIRQFGPEAGFLHNLASGADPRPVQLDSPPLVLEGSHDCEPPVSEWGPLISRAGRVIATLAADIARRGYQVEGLSVKVEDEGGEKHKASAPIKPPSADPDRLTRQASTLLERLRPPCAVTGLKVTLYPLRPAHLGATQLALFASPAQDRLTRLQEVLRRLRVRFGEMIIVVASFLAPPPPRPIQVTPDHSSAPPRAIVWPDRILSINQVYEHWRERRRWWTRPVERDYYRVETVDEHMRVIFRDRRNGRWWLERRYL